MKTANGMKIMGRAFRRAPRSQAKDARSLRDIVSRQQAEKERARERLERLRKVTASAGQSMTRAIIDMSFEATAMIVLAWLAAAIVHTF